MRTMCFAYVLGLFLLFKPFEIYAHPIAGEEASHSHVFLFCIILLVTAIVLGLSALILFRFYNKTPRK